MTSAVQQLLDTKLWRLDPRKSYPNPRVLVIHSDMMGFSDGRFRIEILELKKRSQGFMNKVEIYFTPYHPNCLKAKSRFDTFEQLFEIIKSVSSDLLNPARKLPGR